MTRNATLEALQVHAGKLLLALVIFLAAWVWDTNAQVQSNTKTLDTYDEHVKDIPRIRTDVEVIKERQKHMEGQVAEANDKLDTLINRAIDANIPHR